MAPAALDPGSSTPSAAPIAVPVAEPPRPITMPVTLTGRPTPPLPARPPTVDPGLAEAAPGSGVIELVAKSAWGSTLSSRLDAMLDAEEEAFAHAPTHRTAPPPPPATTRGRITHEVLAEDVEATIDLTPSSRSEHSGLWKGPPPNTRPVQVIPATPEPADDRDDGPTVVRPRPGSMLPPRSRTKAD
jgi:hypothetical protein